MACQLRNLKRNWRTDPTFKDFASMLSTLEDEELVDILTHKAETAFPAALENRTKHWMRWKKELIIHSVFGEWPCGMIAARLIFGAGDEFMEPYGLLPKAKLPVIETSNSLMQGKLKSIRNNLAPSCKKASVSN